MAGETDGTRIGLICNAEHEVFSVVADGLERLGYEVTFLEPGRRLDASELDDLALLANKKVDPESFRALEYARAHGVPTWNGYGTALLGVRPLGLWALAAVGFHVPSTSVEKPAGAYVAKPFVDWHFVPDPVLNGEGDLYQELLPTEPVDYKYYAVDDGRDVHVSVLRSTSKLYGEKEYLDHVEPEPAVAAKLRRLLAVTDSQAIGVDVVRSRGRRYAVDVNPAMSFRHAGMEPALVDSMDARARSRPPRVDDESDRAVPTSRGVRPAVEPS